MMATIKTAMVTMTRVMADQSNSEFFWARKFTEIRVIKGNLACHFLLNLQVIAGFDDDQDPRQTQVTKEPQSFTQQVSCEALRPCTGEVEILLSKLSKLPHLPCDLHQSYLFRQIMKRFYFILAADW